MYGGLHGIFLKRLSVIFPEVVIAEPSFESFARIQFTGTPSAVRILARGIAQDMHDILDFRVILQYPWRCN